MSAFKKGFKEPLRYIDCGGGKYSDTTAGMAEWLRRRS